MPETSTPQPRRKRRTRRRRGKLTTAEASLGIYLDFEGLTDAPPLLAGVLVPSETSVEDVVQSLVDDRFSGFGAATGLTAHDLEELMVTLVEKAEKEQRRIIAWSEHELDVVRDWCSKATSTRFAARFRNARAVADKWRTAVYPELDLSRPDRDENALANYLELIDYLVPEHVGYGTAAKNIRRLLGPASANREWASLSENQRQYWNDLLVHNQHDCIGMYRVSLRAAEELAASTRRQNQDQPGSSWMEPKAPYADCEHCPLKDQPFVSGVGRDDAKYVIVGEAPGSTEVDTGVPFTGDSGKLR